jgi:hypothetical protein
MPFVRDDGGRAEAGYKGDAGDCVARAVSIVTGLPYKQVYSDLASINQAQRKGKKMRGAHLGRRTARHGIFTNKTAFKRYMAELGFEWIPTMQIGSGCKVHLAEGELPMGNLIVSVSRHVTAVIDGVIHDTYDPQRTTNEIGVKGGIPYQKTYERCVYGYWRLVASTRRDGPVLREAVA